MAYKKKLVVLKTPLNLISQTYFVTLHDCELSLLSTKSFMLQKTRKIKTLRST